ncbi:MAG: hypothetical protein HY859_09385 [Caulobacterales bacterium]|nr:hypothetical protein [Caulobacterales bacterium]
MAKSPIADDADYQALKAWCAYILGLSLPPQLVELFHRSTAEQETKSAARARSGLQMAINDCLEATCDFRGADLQVLDRDLAALNLPTLSALRVRFWKRIAQTIKRGRIRNDTDFHAVRNIVETPEFEPQSEAIWAMLTAYEERDSRDR